MFTSSLVVVLKATSGPTDTEQGPNESRYGCNGTSVEPELGLDPVGGQRRKRQVLTFRDH